MKTEYKTCPNCNKKIGGILSSNYILSVENIEFINLFKSDRPEAYCYECGYQLLLNCKNKLKTQKDEQRSLISDLLINIPVITLQNPSNWDYTVIDMVTAQSVSGTGVISEIASSWSDLVGGQSQVLGNKLSNGEDICKNQLRLKAVAIGANCIIATDIDYAEVGGAKGMLMVCMSGTAVLLKNISNVLPKQASNLNTLQSAMEELNRLKAIKIPSSL
jgi:uncharacterized protein YbjQ (UPF0145 family)